MRFCNSLILVSLTSSGASTGVADEAALAGVGGFFPPVSHMMATIKNARPMRSQDWTFFGRRPWGFGDLSCTCWGWIGWLMGEPSVPGSLPRKRQFLFADG